MPAKTIIDEREFLALLDQGKKPVDIARHFGVSPAAITKKIKKYRPNPVVQQYTRKRNHDELDEGKKQYTDKKAQYVEARLSGKKPAQAAMMVYDCSSPQSAAVMGNRMEKDPQIKRAISDCLLDAGVTPAYRAGKIRAILDEGSFDHQIKALDHTAKLTGDYTINVNIQEKVTWPKIVDNIRKNALQLKAIVEELREIDASQTIVALWDGGQRLCIAHLQKECCLTFDQAERALQEFYAGKSFFEMPFIKEALQGKFINFHSFESEILELLLKCGSAVCETPIMLTGGQEDPAENEN